MIISRITGSRSSAMNMCSVRQRPMPSAPSSRAFAASSGVSAFARTASLRNPSAHSSTVSKSSLICGGTTRDAAEDHAARAAVDRQEIAFGELVAVERGDAGGDVDREPLAPGHARNALAARDDGGVRGQPAVRREDAGCVAHAVVVVGGRLPADEDHGLAGLAELLGDAGIEDDLAGGRAG